MRERPSSEHIRDADHASGISNGAHSPRGLATVGREAEIEAVLAAPSERCIAQSFAQKERALAAVFEQLSPTESRALAERLRRPRPNDTLASLFHRMVESRRERLLRQLDGAREREARRMAGAGGCESTSNRVPVSRPSAPSRR